MARRKQGPPPGGPATINGVIYQLLWSLLRATKLNARFGSVGQDGVRGAIVTLEPADGGDVAVTEEHRVVVEQIKSKGADGTWSFDEIVSAVLPDLYRAVDLGDPTKEYRFVTNGRVGLWSKAQDFITLLAARRTGPQVDAFLDKPIDSERRPKKKTGRVKWDFAALTGRKLIERIADAMREAGVAKEDSETKIREKTRHLLERFRIVSEQTVDTITRAIDRDLLAVIEFREDIPVKRDALAFRLAQLAANGSADIDAAVFLNDFGFNATSINDWRRVQSKATQSLQHAIKARRYCETFDVRRQWADRLVSNWRDGSPIFIVTGESGRGKSWLSYAIADISRGTTVAVWVDGTGAFRDIIASIEQAIASAFGHEQPIRLAAWAERLRTLCPQRRPPWATIVVDGVNEKVVAAQLCAQDWEGAGVRVAITMSGDVADAVNSAIAPRAQYQNVGDFTAQELTEFLKRRLGAEWSSIPADVRRALRQPLLAQLYCDTYDDISAWTPTNEYELFERFWRSARLTDDTAASFDSEALASLCAETIRLNGGFQWSAGTLHAHRIDNVGATRLVQRCWLRRIDSSFEVPHDRLLNWAVAEGMATQIAQGTLPVPELRSLVKNLIVHNFRLSGKYFGYLVLDLIWMLTEGARRSIESASAILAELESDRPAGDIYESGLRTIGARALPLLEHRLLEIAATNTPRYLLNAIADCMTAVDSPAISEIALRLLSDPRPLARCAAARILAKRPAAPALDSLWDMACEPIPPDRDDAPDYFDALRACCERDLGWLDRKLASADWAAERVGLLTSILASIPSAQSIWKRHKDRLRGMVGDEPGAFYEAIIAFRDIDETEWLGKRAFDKNEHVSGAAMRALASVHPDRALEVLQEVTGRTAQWWVGARGLRALLARHSNRRQAASMIEKWLLTTTDPWAIAYLLHGSEWAVTAPMMDRLMDALSERIATIQEQSADSRRTLYRALEFLSTLCYEVHLECFRRRRGSEFEQALLEWLESRGLRATGIRDHECEFACDVLARIGGDKFTALINLLLEVPGRIDGINLAFKRPDARAISLLAKFARETPTDPMGTVRTQQAMISLERSEAWDGLVDAIVGQGPGIPRDLGRSRRNGCEYSNAIIKRIARMLDAGPITPGLIRAIDVLRAPELAQRIPSILRGADPTSDLALACVLALRAFPKLARTVQPQLIEQLDIPGHAHAASIQFLELGTKSAERVLLKRLETQYDDLLAVNLMHRKSCREQVAQIIWQEIRRSKHALSAEFRIEALGFLADDESKDFLLERSFADEGRGWIVGSRRDAIRGLGHRDSVQAFAAAERALRTPDARDRHLYPDLLVELDRSKAVNALLKQLEAENSRIVVRAIGAALPPAIRRKACLDRLKSDKVRAVIVGATLSADLRPGAGIESQLFARARFGPREALPAIIRATQYRRHAREANIVLGRMRRTTERALRWCLIDALVSLGDFGTREVLIRPWWIPENRAFRSDEWVYFESKVRAKRDAISLQTTSDKEKDMLIR